MPATSPDATRDGALICPTGWRGEILSSRFVKNIRLREQPKSVLSSGALETSGAAGPMAVAAATLRWWMRNAREGDGARLFDR